MRFCVLALCLPLLQAAQTPLQTADAKMDKFNTDGYRPGDIVTFSPAELDAWIRDEVPKYVMQGVREPKIELGQGTALGSAMVDFVKLEQSLGKTPGMIAKMFAGERSLKVSVRIASGAGRCTVYLTRVEVGGVSMEGKPLDLLISTFFKPLFPDAHINEPFDLGYNMERIEFQPGGIQAFIKK